MSKNTNTTKEIPSTFTLRTKQAPNVPRSPRKTDGKNQTTQIRSDSNRSNK